MIFTEEHIDKIMKQIVELQPLVVCLGITQGKIITPNHILYIKGKTVTAEDQEKIIQNIGNDLFCLCKNTENENIFLDIKLTTLKYEEIYSEKVLKVLIDKKSINKDDDVILSFLRGLQE